MSHTSAEPERTNACIDAPPNPPRPSPPGGGFDGKPSAPGRISVAGVSGALPPPPRVARRALQNRRNATSQRARALRQPNARTKQQQKYAPRSVAELVVVVGRDVVRVDLDAAIAAAVAALVVVQCQLLPSCHEARSFCDTLPFLGRYLVAVVHLDELFARGRLAVLRLGRAVRVGQRHDRVEILPSAACERLDERAA